MNQKITVGFIGAGNMGSAIMKGIMNSELSQNMTVSAFDPDTQKLNSLSEVGIKPCSSGLEVMQNCKYIFLAVKPQMFESVLGQLKDGTTSDTVFVSIAAGITADYIRSKTLPNAKVILVMPNTPLLLGQGASALAKAEPTSDEEFQTVQSIFNSCGISAQLPEDKMKEIIAINGSSPAFIYLFAKAFVDYAAKEGIHQDVSLPLFAQTLIGSAKMLTDSGCSIDELIKMVSSPGGTTLAGLDELYKGNLAETVNNACSACTKRAYELSK